MIWVHEPHATPSAFIADPTPSSAGPQELHRVPGAPSLLDRSS